MSKVLFLIVSGEEASAKAEAGITVAARSLAAKRYDDLKCFSLDQARNS